MLSQQYFASVGCRDIFWLLCWWFCRKWFGWLTSISITIQVVEPSIARRPIRTNCTTGVRTYFCKSTECPESWSSIAAAIAQVGFLSRRRQSKLCTSSAHFLVIRSRIYGHQVAMIPLRSWRFFVVPQTRFFLFHPTLPASPSFRASKARLEI